IVKSFSNSVVTSKEAIRHFLSDDIEYYHINSMSADDIKILMLASSAISFIFESVHFKGKRLIDAGGTDFGNIPITPLYDNGCKEMYVAPLDNRFNINKIKNFKDNVNAETAFPNCKFTVIKPSKDLGFMLDFSKHRFNKNFNLGESDSTKILKDKIHYDRIRARSQYINEVVKIYKKYN
ncbi:MAG: hypothetical protein NC192_05525, partial [Muribaculaceae bacterium]|nr:hypothetical protein [Muribaculaceae bacterium]